MKYPFTAHGDVIDFDARLSKNPKSLVIDRGSALGHLSSLQGDCQISFICGRPGWNAYPNRRYWSCSLEPSASLGRFDGAHRAFQIWNIHAWGNPETEILSPFIHVK
jgi:hypothetical protein